MRLITAFSVPGVLAALFALAACTNQMEPAQQALSRADAAVNAAAPDAAKYLPDQLGPLQSKLADLKASFDKKDYQTVLANAPGVEQDATKLAQDASAKKAEVAKALEMQWTDVSGSVSSSMDRVKARVAELGKKGKRVPKGIDLAGAQSDLAAADGLWQQAQSSHTAGDMEKAVSSAKDAKAKIDAAAAAIKLDLSSAPTK